MSFCNINGLETYVRIEGKGDPVVFVHGLGLDNRIWDYQIPQISNSHETIFYDLRGHGQSAALESGYSYENYASDLGALINECARPPVHLVGLSMGGAIAFRFARKHPDDVRSLTLVSPHICGYNAYENWPGMYKIARNQGMDAARETWKDFRLFSSIKSDPDRWAKLSDMIDGFSCAPWTDPSPRYNEENDLDRADEVTVPALLISATGDKDFMPIAERLRLSLPDSRLEMFDCGHLVNYELPLGFNEALLAFLREIS